MNYFNKDYYENGISSGLSLYTNYKWMPDLTIPMAFRIIEILNIKESDSILDFGCAKGYMVKSFRMLYRDAYGVDISDYAISNCDKEVENYLLKIEDIKNISQFNKIFDYTISKDVFEHISYEYIEDTIISLRQYSKCLFAVIPLGDGKKYYIPSYELDKTHIIKEDKDWWIDLFKKCGFKDVSFEYKIKGIKENYNKIEKGNGFFILR
jgi:SAM-dependent methyltransferase